MAGPRKSTKLKGRDPNYKRSPDENRNQFDPVSFVNGRPLKLGASSLIMGQEMEPLAAQSQVVHPNIINMPNKRFARRPQFLLTDQDRGRLLQAVEAGNMLRVFEHLDMGVPANTRDTAGVPALHWAAARGYISITYVLLQRGADVNVREEYGQTTPLFFAV
jgi:ankyrin repeat protein